MALNLAHNEAFYPPAPGCLAVHHEMTGDTLRRYAPNFAANEPSPLTVRLAQLCAVDVDRVICGGAGSLGLLSDVFATLHPGDAVAVPEGAWPQYAAEAAKVHARVITYRVYDFGNRFVADPDGLLALAEAGTPIRLVLLTSPANPTGEAFPVDRVGEVARAFPNATVFADLVYTGCADDPPDWTAWAALTRRHPNLITLYTFSKAFALAGGARTGWMIVGDAHDELVARGVPYLGYNRTAELTCIAALDDPGYYERMRLIMAEERRRFASVLSLAGPDGTAAAYASGGNFVPVRFTDAVSVSLARTALAAAEIKIKWLSGGLTRITLGTPEQNGLLLRTLVHALARLGAPVPPHRGDLIPAYQLAAAGNGSPQ